ncbi:hypothetical protein [Phreatobacter sp.]|uniref:hypothetical protein n=1 Tax=Phreatobacter sp. TaxID=1966341 RepID=UPI003F72EE4E
MATRETNWTNVVNVIGATVLVGCEAIGAGAATGWAFSSLLGLGERFVMGSTAVGIGIGLLGTFAFFRSARRVEPFNAR